MLRRDKPTGRFPFLDDLPRFLKKAEEIHSNLKLMQQKKNEADKAKRILFGRTDIEVEKEYEKGCKDALDSAEFDEKAKEAIRNMDFVSPDLLGLEKLGKIDNDYVADAIKKYHQTPLEVGPIKPLNWHEEHERFDQINRVLDYCNEAGISPDDLINFYNEHHTQPPK